MKRGPVQSMVVLLAFFMSMLIATKAGAQNVSIATYSDNVSVYEFEHEITKKSLAKRKVGQIVLDQISLKGKIRFQLLHLVSHNKNNPDVFEISMRDAEQNIIGRVRSFELLADGIVESSYSLNVDDKPEIDIYLSSSKNNVGSKLKISTFAKSIEGRTDSFVGESWDLVEGHNITSVANASVYSKIETGVARLFFRDEENYEITDYGAASEGNYCSGFLLKNRAGNSDDAFRRKLLATNYHCVSNQSDCDAMTALFGYQRTSAKRMRVGQAAACQKILYLNKRLDFALVVLEFAQEPQDSLHEFRVSSAELSLKDQTFLIQYPAGWSKRVAEPSGNCQVVYGSLENGVTYYPQANKKQYLEKRDVIHNCDTLGGSSGSPLTDNGGAVIGVHYDGLYVKEARDSVYHVGMIADRNWNKNRAISMIKIMDCLRFDNARRLHLKSDKSVVFQPTAFCANDLM